MSRRLPAAHRRALVALGLILVAFAALLLVVEAQWGPLWHADRGVSGDLHTVAVGHAWFVTLMDAVSTIGSSSVYVPLYALATAWLLWRRRPRPALFVAVTAAGSSLLNSMVKASVDRPRPVLPDPVAHAAAASFPSGHAQASVVMTSVLLLALAPALERRRRALAVGGAAAWAIAVGFSRVALGLHFASDVVAGYLLGGAWIAVMGTAFGVWRAPAPVAGIQRAEYAGLTRSPCPGRVRSMRSAPFSGSSTPSKSERSTRT